MSRYCIIPARSGSKGLKNKNMLFLSEKHVVEYSIIAALDSGLFDHRNIIFSTDSEEYIESLKKYNITFNLRPKKFSDDLATTNDLLKYLISLYPEMTELVLLQPTSPFRESHHVASAWEFYVENEYDTVISCSEAPVNQSLYTSIDGNGRIVDNIGVDTNYRRQNFEIQYVPNGSIFISSVDNYIKTNSFYTDNTGAFIMNKKSSIDIDDRDDFINALGHSYFDREKRELDNADYFENEYRNFMNSNLSHWVVGDSRITGYSKKGYLNLSIPGVTLNTFLHFFRNVRSGFPKTMILSLGINDLMSGYSNETIKRNYIDLFELCKKREIDLSISLILYTIYNFNVDNDRIEYINSNLKSYCLDNGIEVLNPNETLSPFKKLKTEYTNDGIHLNSKGQKILFAQLTEFINNIES